MKADILRPNLPAELSRFYADNPAVRAFRILEARGLNPPVDWFAWAANSCGFPGGKVGVEDVLLSWGIEAPKGSNTLFCSVSMSAAERHRILALYMAAFD